MTRSLALVVVLALLGPGLVRPAATAPHTPAGGKVARPARKAVGPIAKREKANDKLITTLERKKAKAEERAGREVLSLPLSPAHSDEDIADAVDALRRVHARFVS